MITATNGVGVATVNVNVAVAVVVASSSRSIIIAPWSSEWFLPSIGFP
jgi:hypothetical protein